MSKLTEFYTNLIDLCGIEISNHGRLVFPIYGEAGESTQIPLQYDNKPIVFPDKLFLEDPENKPGDVIVLHPLSESSGARAGLSGQWHDSGLGRLVVGASARRRDCAVPVVAR